MAQLSVDDLPYQHPSRDQFLTLLGGDPQWHWDNIYNPRCSLCLLFYSRKLPKEELDQNRSAFKVTVSCVSVSFPGIEIGLELEGPGSRVRT